MLAWLSQLDPQVLLVGCIAIGTLLAFPLLALGVGRLAQLRLLTGLLCLGAGATVFVMGLGAGAISASLHTYRRLTEEQVAAKVAARRIGERQYIVTLAVPGEAPRQLQLLGDEWQIDARVVKWRPMATVAGFDTVYRLERLSGRYADVEMERTAPRSVYVLSPREPLDLWQAVRAYREWLPMIDARYGSAAYVPLAPDATYVVSVSPSGLVVRPENEAARRALGAWK